MRFLCFSFGVDIYYLYKADIKEVLLVESILIVVIIMALIFLLFSVVRAVSPSNNGNSASEGLGERHTVYRSSGSKGFTSITYTGDVRYLDGKPIQTTDEFERWRVINSQALAMRDHLRFLQQRIVDPSEPKAAQYYDEWMRRYQTYRQLVVRHKLWNMAVDINEPFRESDRQLQAEKAFLSKLEHSYEASIADREACMLGEYENHLIETEIINYLNSCPRKKAEKKTLVAALSNGDMEKRKLINRRYHSLLLRGIIGEKKDENGNTITRIIIRRNAKSDLDSQGSQLPASKYKPSFYENVYSRTVLKAELTVGSPLNVDKRKNTCHFISQTDGSEYLTSLEQCTCPAFSNRPDEPCKHMVALAAYLGYYQYKD